MDPIFIASAVGAGALVTHATWTVVLDQLRARSLRRRVEAWPAYAKSRGLTAVWTPESFYGELRFEGVLDSQRVQIEVVARSIPSARVRSLDSMDVPTVCARRRGGPDEAHLARSGLLRCSTGDAAFDTAFDVACEDSEKMSLALDDNVRASLLACGAQWFEASRGKTEVVLLSVDLDGTRVDAALDAVTGSARWRCALAGYR